MLEADRSPPEPAAGKPIHPVVQKHCPPCPAHVGTTDAQRAPAPRRMRQDAGASSCLSASALRNRYCRARPWPRRCRSHHRTGLRARTTLTDTFGRPTVRSVRTTPSASSTASRQRSFVATQPTRHSSGTPRTAAATGRDADAGAAGAAVRDRDAMVVMDVAVTAAAALAAGYPLGRLRPWQRVGGWAADQVRCTGAWVEGGTCGRPSSSWSTSSPRRAPAGASCAPRPPRHRHRRPYAIRTGSPTALGRSASRRKVTDSPTGNRPARPLSTEQGPDSASGPSSCPGIFPPGAAVRVPTSGPRG